MTSKAPADAKSKKTPSSLGFSMPAEWEEHEGTWLSWPHNVETWPGKLLADVEEVYAQMVEGLAGGEKVKILVNDAKEEEIVSKRLNKKGVKMSNVVFYRVPTVDSWIRDYGPIFVAKGSGANRELLANHWIFNAWGGKYESLMADTAIPDKISGFHGTPSFKPGIILEGGSIEVNGAGAVMTTEQCLLNKNRNPHLTREEIENYLRTYLGVSDVIWLGEGIVGDDTDGHIDDIARFIDEKTILAAVEPDKSDPNHEPLQENLERLKKYPQYRVVELPMPGPVGDELGRLPASYANFYIGNSAVLLPVYRHANDKIAVKILEKAFPSKQIVPIVCNSLVYGLGAIHCVTQQHPAGRPAVL